ncbi:hypothetical protein O0I10_009719 [Lichtheimia ornata]|uniref:Uncharacterized protein n=1 Tax=Lichtheimia ornata TaxID=688661 RepID=A0AAD7XVL5_9FUNG|nr:uncharacterized protein O0I10_009719 [Lichtheimia ornata]KAJ8654668.1 hypothetical protein O0I10_009719 [Lichtheimia ornata]
MTVLLLLLESASGQECESRYFSLDYCGSTYTNCTYSIFKYHEPKSNLVSSIGRGCGESTKQVCKGKDWLGCMNSPQCVWWQTYSRDDPTKEDNGCREFDCSYGLTEDYCGQFKDCVFDQKDSNFRNIDDSPWNVEGYWRRALAAF